MRDLQLRTDWLLQPCAELTKNFSGAEIQGLVKSAISFALNRQIDVNNLSKPVDETNLKVILAATQAFQIPNIT